MAQGQWRQADNALGSRQRVEGRRQDGAYFKGRLKSRRKRFRAGRGARIEECRRRLHGGAKDRLRAGLVHNRQAPEGGFSKMKREALAASRRRAVVNPCATRGMVERSGVPLVRRTMDQPSAKRQRTGTRARF